MKSPNLSVAVAGSSGFLGQAVVRALTLRGCRVKRLIRTQPTKDTSSEVYWNPTSGHIERVGLEGVDVLINLTGAGLFDKRWSPSRKEQLFTSRVESTRLLSRTLCKLKNPPKLFLSASGIADHESGFLGHLCQEWEAATHAAEAHGIRVIHLRTGVVLDPKGGFLKAVMPLFKSSLGGVIGDGQQQISWISLADWISACEFLIFNAQLSGPVHLVGPHPASNEEFSKTLAQVLHRPCVLRIPAWLLELVYGEMGRVLMLEGTRVLPEELLKAGFEFQHPNLREALEACIRKS